MKYIQHIDYLQYLYSISFLCDLWYLQSNFRSEDIPYRTMRTMSDRLIKQILPDEKIHKVDLHEGMCLSELFRLTCLYNVDSL